ncbi:GPR endopeptidase [Clostridium vincentii]|uniref:Germination protease n=1 Tax=Clostridium vincentii TaxID=52704 RepID=A0A2T0BJ62_9CLOT|nr:GPR endopeptidase [Clostridium vincentii]PRR83938.1 Germination protease precursor [Clostridium vincentii]
MINVRTDLAIEARQIYKEENNDEDTDGIVVEEVEEEGTKITTVRILNEEGAKNMGKPIGNYITLDIPEFTAYDGELMDDVSKVLGKTLKKLVNLSEDKLVLVVGLGNRKVTPDALGPKVIEGIMVTRHLKAIMPETIDDSIAPVAAIAPGVLGITGVETGEIIRGLVEKIKPDLVICIDALASRKIERLNRTIQISDTGISPGSGVGNHRMQINEQSLGVKVIAVGVPTVVDAATIANDTIDLVLDDLIRQSEDGKEFYNMLKKVDKDEKSVLIREVLNPFVKDLVVTPKDIDLMIDSLSKIISNGINIAVQPNLTVEDINKFLN